jgi:hypothetical protein
MGEPRLDELKMLGNLAAEWETRANCATSEVERLTGEVGKLRDAERAADKHIGTLEATCADLRSVNDVLRAQLAEAQAEAARARANGGWENHGDGGHVLIQSRQVAQVTESETGGFRFVNNMGCGQGGADGWAGNLELAKRLAETAAGVRP